MLELKKRGADDKLFAQYRSCVFSNRNSPGSVELRVETDLSLEALRGQHYPPTSSPRAISSRFICDLNGADSAAPNRFPDIPDPCYDPSAAELNSRALGPVQTVYESLNQYISLGGSDHINRQ